MAKWEKRFGETTRLMAVLVIIFLILSVSFKSVLAEDFISTGRWRADNGYVAGITLASYGYDFTVAFNMTGDGNWTLISGTYSEVFYGFYWNGSQWVSDSSRVTGLSIGTYRATPNVAFNVTGDGNWTLISGDQLGKWHGFYWNGIQWVSDSSRIVGLDTTGNGNSNPEMAFNFTGDGNWTLISGEYYGHFYGWYWNGTQWVSKSSLVSGLSVLPAQGRSSPTIGYNVSGQNRWIFISGQYYGNQYGFYWNGTQWIADQSLVVGASKLGNILSYPCLVHNFTGDNRWVLMLTHSSTQISGFYYGDLHLNFRVIDSKGAVVENTYITIFNGSYYNQYTSEDGWANFTGITVLPVTAEIRFQDIIVNTTSVTTNSKESIDIRCQIYSLTIKVVNIADQPIPNIPLELYRNGILLNGLYDLPQSPMTNESGMFTLQQLAYQTTSYTIVIPGATSQTTTLTEDTTITLTLFPFHKPAKLPPPPSPKPHEIIITTWTEMSPEQRTATVIGGASVAALIAVLLKRVKIKIV